MRIFPVLVALLSGASLAVAEGFTAPEKVELAKLERAGEFIRIGERNLETLISTSTGEDTRALLAKADHIFQEVEEGVGNGSLYYLGIVQERDSDVIDQIKAGPRSGFIVRGNVQFHEAQEEAEKGLKVLDSLALLRQSDSAYQLQVSRARIQLINTTDKLESFINTPIDWDNSTPLPNTLPFLDQVWQARQYSYDVAEIANVSYGSGLLLSQPLNRKYSEVLSRIWLFTDKIMDAAFASAGVINNEQLEAILLQAPQYLHVVQVGLAGLKDVYVGDFARTLIKLSDAWRHLDHLAYLWVTNGF